MAGYSNPEPNFQFTETTLVKRNFVQNYEVKIVYYNTGRGVFTAEGGKIISDETVESSRRLTIKINQMEEYFQITRARGGVYEVSDGYQINVLGRKYNEERLTI